MCDTSVLLLTTPPTTPAVIILMPVPHDKKIWRDDDALLYWQNKWSKITPVSIIYMWRVASTTHNTELTHWSDNNVLDSTQLDSTRLSTTGARHVLQTDSLITHWSDNHANLIWTNDTIIMHYFVVQVTKSTCVLSIFSLDNWYLSTCGLVYLFVFLFGGRISIGSSVLLLLLAFLLDWVY
jgi:hypothetical protein